MVEDLFKQGAFNLASGLGSWWKIECEAISDHSWRTLAAIIAERIRFSEVVGVPRGGLKLADALQLYKLPPGHPLLIVDDVWTTGMSMREELGKIGAQWGPNYRGVVVFARGPVDNWVMPLFQMHDLPRVQPPPSLCAEHGEVCGRVAPPPTSLRFGWAVFVEPFDKADPGGGVAGPDSSLANMLLVTPEDGWLLAGSVIIKNVATGEIAYRWHPRDGNPGWVRV